MKINIITLSQVEKIVKREVRKNQKMVWKELDRLRAKILKWEMKNIDVGKIDVGKNKR